MASFEEIKKMQVDQLIKESEILIEKAKAVSIKYDYDCTVDALVQKAIFIKNIIETHKIVLEKE